MLFVRGGASNGASELVASKLTSSGVVRLQLASCKTLGEAGPGAQTGITTRCPARAARTMMGAAALLCVASLLEAATGSYVMTDSTIRTAVAEWLSNSGAAQATYGHISTWETGGVTDMSELFCAWSDNGNCNTAAASFNEDIGAWDTSGVTTMYRMFFYASAFNRDIGGWAVQSVTDMTAMFYEASAFDHDLGWCVDDGATYASFYGSGCESTYCGVKWETNAGDCDFSRTGNVMVNWKIKWAVAAWLSNPTAAEAAYGHISTWQTGGVTDMDYLFDVAFNSGAASFNEDISAWDTSGVTTMRLMFYRASAFDQNLGDWAVHSVTDMYAMFKYASAFDQDLGWCVDNDVNLGSAFVNTPCELTYCGVMWEANTGDCDVPRTDNVMVNWKIKGAVAAWLSNPTAAEAAYGHISSWETGGVTDMEQLFCSVDHSGSGLCNSAAASFNEDIGAWDTSGVTTMNRMFYNASAFNRDIGDWAVHSVRDMNQIFREASAFDQDLGWCVDNDVNLGSAFVNTPCYSTSCGIKQVAGGCAPTPAPTPKFLADDASIRMAVAAWLSNPTAAEATYGHISTWETGGVTDMTQLFCGCSWCGDCNAAAAAASFNEDIGAWDTSGVTTMYRMFFEASAFDQDIGDWQVDKVTSTNGMFDMASAFNRDIGDWAVHSVTDMTRMFDYASAFDQDLGWCVDDDVGLGGAFSGTPCESTSCGVKQVQGGCAPTPAPTATPVTSSSSGGGGGGGGGAIAVIVGAAAAVVLLLAVGAFCFYRRRKASTIDKADEPSGASSPTKSNPEPTELPPPGEESLETRAAASAKAKAAETAERPGFARKLSSFLFGEQEEATVAEAEEAPPAEQPPPPPTPAEPAAPKAEEMYNQIAAWYNAPENAALRASWGAYPDPDEFQTWPGFVAVTNAFLDREAG